MIMILLESMDRERAGQDSIIPKAKVALAI